MDYVKPYGVVGSMLAGGAVKLSLPPRQLLLRGMLAGAYLGIGTEHGGDGGRRNRILDYRQPPLSIRIGPGHSAGRGDHHR